MGLKLIRRDLRTDTLPSGYTLTRTGTGSIASYINSSGVLTFVAADVARFDYNSSTLARKGLLIEEARTNYLLHNRNISNAAWSLFGAGTANGAGSATLNSETGYRASLGTVTDPLFDNRSALYQGVTPPIGTFTASIRWAGYLATKSVQAGLAVGGGNATTSSILSLPATSWTTTTITKTAASSVLGNVSMRHDNTAANPEVLVSAVDLQLGAFATSHILTTTASAARGADVVSIGTPPITTTQSFAVVLNYSLLPGASIGGPLFSATNMTGSPGSAASGRTVIRFNSATNLWDFQHSGGSLQATAAYVSSTITALKLGTDNTNYANATFSGIDWYQGLATNGQMQQLSNGTVLGSDRGMIRSPITKIIKSPITGVI